MTTAILDHVVINVLRRMDEAADLFAAASSELINVTLICGKKQLMNTWKSRAVE